MENEQFQDIRRILIPLDGSTLSENALKYGISIANKFGAEIVLVSVYASKEPDSLLKKRLEEMDPNLGKEVEKMHPLYLIENYHTILKNALAKKKISIKSVLRDANISTDSVVNVLLDLVKKENIDLVVISSHGKSGFRKLKLGSVTEELIKALMIPVLCVKK
ncbi:MAG: universal stress protein [Candidatus Methanoperedens sp.]|nr:universal stress protein [Candidatus Methanoperedens sp.]